MTTMFRCLAATLLFALTACATQPVAVQGPLPFEQAVQRATDDLVAQTGLMAQLARKAIVQDPSLDAHSGQQTGTTTRLDAGVVDRLRAKFDILPFRSASLANAESLLVGTMAREPGARLRISLSLVDLRSGVVVAHAESLARDEALDHAPLPYHRDSPVLVKDKVIEGYIATSRTPRGRRGDSFYLERIAIATRVNEATELYNQARYREALGEYRSALAGPAGEQLRVLNGIYLSSARLGNAGEAEAAFGRVVAMGIAYRQLSVKFLFNPGTIAFWVDPRINAPYAMWLRQIAREATQARACMNIVGHTSKSGKAAANEALSLRRAAEIRRRLVAESPVLSKRTDVAGKGFRETLIGSGTDDVLDVLDRRVEFRIVPCEDVVSR